MWAGTLHLVFGNIIIGVVEGIILARIFKLEKKKLIGLLILANYFSAWIGGFFLRIAIVTVPPAAGIVSFQ